jgi:hypothetical protein
VTRRELLAVALVLLVTITDAANAPTLSFYLLLAAVPAIVVAGLAAVEDVLEGALHRKSIAMLHAVALLFVLVAAALRSPLRAEGTIPTAGVSAVIACLVVFAIQGVIAALPFLRRTVEPAPEAREVSVP